MTSCWLSRRQSPSEMGSTHYGLGFFVMEEQILSYKSKFFPVRLDNYKVEYTVIESGDNH